MAATTTEAGLPGREDFVRSRGDMYDAGDHVAVLNNSSFVK
jgi:hypothetical protein